MNYCQYSYVAVLVAGVFMLSLHHQLAEIGVRELWLGGAANYQCVAEGCRDVQALWL
jgi:hypothetical protein